jgi:hypothetical protein
MIADSVVVFGSTGNVIVFVNGGLPKNAPIMFRVSSRKLELMSNDQVVYTERGITPDICDRIKDKNEIGLVEVIDAEVPPRHLTNIAYQYAYL